RGVVRLETVLKGQDNLHRNCGYLEGRRVDVGGVQGTAVVGPDRMKSAVREVDARVVPVIVVGVVAVGNRTGRQRLELDIPRPSNAAIEAHGAIELRIRIRHTIAVA